MRRIVGLLGRVLGFFGECVLHVVASVVFMLFVWALVGNFGLPATVGAIALILVPAIVWVWWIGRRPAAP